MLSSSSLTEEPTAVGVDGVSDSGGEDSQLAKGGGMGCASGEG